LPKLSLGAQYGGLGSVDFAEEARAQERKLGFTFDHIVVCTLTGSAQPACWSALRKTDASAR
jgi:1-aminocyclopropane-1-carboxylate deaminase/D-cysteine desulfhydrase-like pyridoxal-dependent ACC family enzyme